MDGFHPNQNLKISQQRMGRSGEPVLVIDNVLADPTALVAAASRSGGWHPLPQGGYPGQRAPLPGAYGRALLARLDGPIRRKLFTQPMVVSRFDCSFSMVTHAPDDLTALQRMPHIDLARGTRVALLHYLCGPGFGGTAFFRQDATGLEQIDVRDRAPYLDQRARDVETLHDDHRYPNEGTPGYTRTGKVDAVFNRVIAYRSFTLHSGIINTNAPLSADPSHGRLTANFFVDYAVAG